MRKLMSIIESQMDPADVRVVFKTAADLRSNPGLVTKFAGRGQDPVKISDLMQAFQDAGYPTDTRDLAHILTNFKFSKSDIKKVFATVFGKGEEQSSANPAVVKLAGYIKQHGMSKDIITFMQREYPEFKNKERMSGLIGEAIWRATPADVMQVFDAIISETTSTTSRRRLGRHRR